MIGDTLLAAKDTLEGSTLYAKWKRDNPREFARIESYWTNGGAFPQTINPFGLFYALIAKAYWESVPHAIGVPSAEAGASVPPADGADVAIHPFPAEAGSRAYSGSLNLLDLSLPFVPV